RDDLHHGIFNEIGEVRTTPSGRSGNATGGGGAFMAIRAAKLNAEIVLLLVATSQTFPPLPPLIQRLRATAMADATYIASLKERRATSVRLLRASRMATFKPAFIHR